MERCLRTHFLFHNMESKVIDFVNSCNDCKAFVDKKTREPIQQHKVPLENWEIVAVDLYGPMPSSNHVVVVQDMGSRYPAAKLVSLTRAESFIPAPKGIYNNYGRPETQILDNGPPFNSKKMIEFTAQSNIELQKIVLLHPSSNPVETFMRPLGKAMKIAHMNKENENDALELLLNNYRDTPHSATGLTPASMLFRDDKRSSFPRKSVRTKGIIKAKEKDQKMKL